MRNIIKFLVASVFFSGALLDAAFRDTSFGVRPEGMGGAFVSVADDVNSVYYNPAGLSSMRSKEAGFVYGIPFAGLENVDVNYVNLSLVYPVRKIASFGISYLDYKQTELYKESIVTFSVVKNLHEIFPIRQKVSVGMNIKYLSHSYNVDADSLGDPVFKKGTAKSALGLDLAVFAQVLEPLNCGLMLRNLNAPDVGILVSDKVISETALGAAYKMGNWKFMEDILFPVEISIRNSSPSETILRAGFESWFSLHTFGFRLGYSSYDSLNFGLSFNKAVSARVILKIDYSVSLLNNISDNAGTHRMSFGVRFD